MIKIILSDFEKREIALALFLLKDIRSCGRNAIEAANVIKKIHELVARLGIKKEYEELYKTMPPYYEIFNKEIFEKF